MQSRRFDLSFRNLLFSASMGLGFILSLSACDKKSEQAAANIDSVKIEGAVKIGPAELLLTPVNAEAKLNEVFSSQAPFVSVDKSFIYAAKSAGRLKLNWSVLYTQDCKVYRVESVEVLLEDGLSKAELSPNWYREQVVNVEAGRLYHVHVRIHNPGECKMVKFQFVTSELL